MTDIIAVCWLIFNEQSTYSSISINEDGCTSTRAEGSSYVMVVVIMAAHVLFFNYLALVER